MDGRVDTVPPSPPRHGELYRRTCGHNVSLAAVSSPCCVLHKVCLFVETSSKFNIKVGRRKEARKFCLSTDECHCNTLVIASRHRHNNWCIRSDNTWPTYFRPSPEQINLEFCAQCVMAERLHCVKATKPATPVFWSHVKICSQILSAHLIVLLLLPQECFPGVGLFVL